MKNKKNSATKTKYKEIKEKEKKIKNNTEIFFIKKEENNFYSSENLNFLRNLLYIN